MLTALSRHGSCSSRLLAGRRCRLRKRCADNVLCIFRLTDHTPCITLYDMKPISAVTIRLDRDLQRQLDRICKQSGRTRSDVVRDALRRQLALLQFEQLRRRVLPFAEARGYLTDEDVADEVS